MPNMKEIETNINEISKEQHARMIEKGFYDENKQIGTILMLTVSELSEALEADRKGRHSNLKEFEKLLQEGVSGELKKDAFKKYMKDTFEDEIADTFIRLFDLCGLLGINIDAHIKHKMWFNSTRPPKHGKAY